MNGLPGNGFEPQANGSGLYVPQEFVRERQVWTHDERKILDRAAKLLKARGVSLLLSCQHSGCEDKPLERVALPGGNFLLRCAHRDRLFVKGF